MEDKLQVKDYNYPIDHLFGIDANDAVAKNRVTNNVYLFSNENLKDYFRCFDFNGATVATVGSSGDQALNAIYYGANDVTLIDGNILSQAFTELKIAAIKNFSFEEFKSFYDNYDFTKYDMYAKISHDLSPDAKMFWDNLFLEAEGGDISELIAPCMFCGKGVASSKQNLNASMFFLSRNPYKHLQERLKDANIKYIYEDINNFSKALDGKKFDFIFLSNIVDYVDRNKFCGIVSQLVDNNLAENGKIQVSYQFCKDDNAADVLKKRLMEEKSLKDMEFNKYGVESLFRSDGSKVSQSLFLE